MEGCVLPDQGNGVSSRKIDAIYELREAAEKKGHDERVLADEPTPEHRDQLLDSMLELEHKTVKALTACHECGHEYGSHEPHCSSSA